MDMKITNCPFLSVSNHPSTYNHFAAFSNPQILEPAGFWELTLLVKHILPTFKMHLSRCFAPAIAVITLLIALSVLAIISVVEGFRTVVFRGGWLKSTGVKWKRDGAGKMPLSFPRK